MWAATPTKTLPPPTPSFVGADPPFSTPSSLAAFAGNLSSPLRKSTSCPRRSISRQRRLWRKRSRSFSCSRRLGFRGSSSLNDDGSQCRIL